MKKTHHSLYTATAAPSLIDIPELSYLMADGLGDPSGDHYKAVVEGLYGVAYAIRTELKPTLTYSVAPLEGLWEGTPDDRAAMQWTMCILQPEPVTPEMVARAVDVVRRKKPGAEVGGIRLAPMAGGRAAQILHTGPYSEEPATVGTLMKFIFGQGLTVVGRHREIYLSVPDRTAPEKMRTIIRYPVAALAAAHGAEG
ncbi:GyrI-like domain-containing protein [Streptosporangium sp. NPDC000396]|uniref:GyrI-like domain-containing protein n=1 Tax=Streptosporangium sp. NPDC000396 TaxID=3366185 RepID=UPI00367ADA96